MKCQICSGKVDKETKICTVCGHNQSQSKRTSLLAAIATVLVIVVLAGGLTAGYFLYGKDKIEEFFIKQQLGRVSQGSILCLYFDDFNGDGSKEAFAVTGRGTESSIIDGDIWFVKNRMGVNIRSATSGTVNGILEEGGKKYFSVETNNKDGKVTSTIFGVDERNNTFQPSVSGKYQKIHQQDDKIVTGDGKEVTMAKIAGE